MTRLSRRSFLRGIGAASVSGLIGRYGAGNAPRTCVVVGSGLSGLAAGYALRRADWVPVVLEARGRIGGRVLSHRFRGEPSLVCELGAEWVGASHERIQQLCREFEIPLRDHRFEASLLRDGVVKRPGQWNFSPQAREGFERLRLEFESYDEARQRALDRYDWWTILQQYGFTEDDLRLRDLMDSTDFGESIRHVSAYAAAGEYFESSPENEMDYKLAGGNSRLIEALADRVGRDAIHTNHRVERITQKDGMVTVTAGGGQEFRADACICTAPTRVLTQIEFDPPLPSDQRAAAEQLQYCRIIKNSVLFKERFWGSDKFSLVSDVTSHYYFHQTRNQPGKPGILCSYAIGEKADILASQDNRRRMALVAGELAPVDRKAPKLARDIASYAWQRDPYTQGAYALYRPGQWFSIRPVLQRPHGKVHFAGEHLADWQGFMEGAVVTGEDAAAALI